MASLRTSRFALLASDSDSSDAESHEAPSPKKAVPPPFPREVRTVSRAVRPAAKKAPPAALPVAGPDPVVAALLRGDIAWGDIDTDGNLLPPLKAAYATTDMGANDFWDALQSETVGLWSQPFAANLEAHAQEAYDTSALTDTTFAEMMTWMCANGWEIRTATRNSVSAAPAGLPPTAWVSLDELYALKEAGSCCAHAIQPPPLAAAGTDGGRRKGAPIPQFCKEGKACTAEGCRYVHGDTIPVKNQPCGGPRDGPHAGNGAHCSKRHAEVGKTPCLFLHPDEAWKEGMCRHRPK